MKNHNSLQQELEKKYSREEKRKKKKMKVSGKSVLGLRKIIVKKTRKQESKSEK